MCQHTSRPAHGRHSRDCGDTREREGGEPPAGGSGVVCSDQSVPSGRQRRPRGCCCRGIPIKVKTCMPSRLAQKELSRADLATWAHVAPTGAFVKAPPCSTLQVEEDETVGGRSLTTLGVGSSHRKGKKNTGAGSGPSEHWVGRIENVTIKKVKDKIAPWPFP